MRRCLIVDESSVVRKVAARIVFQLGFEVEGLASMEEAKASIEANGLPGLLIVAAASAGGDAAGLVRDCRAMPGGQDSVVLALLVEANLGLMTRMKRAGAEGFLFKPFTRAELAEGLRPHIERKLTPAVAA